MAKKSLEVQKFGGTDSLGTTSLHGYDHDVESIETQSKTRLEDDNGYGNAAIIRMFDFQGNPEVWKQKPPTKQDLMNHHAQGIRIALWKDGLEANEDIPPRIQLSQKSFKYRIFVTAKPAKGHILPFDAKMQTLKEIVHG